MQTWGSEIDALTSVLFPILEVSLQTFYCMSHEEIYNIYVYEKNIHRSKLHLCSYKLANTELGLIVVTKNIGIGIFVGRYLYLIAKVKLDLL